MHHAYIYEGSLALLRGLCADARERFGLSEAAHNPDAHAISIEKFGIDDAHALRAQAAMKPVGGRALFVVGFSTITSEAQQALLKLLEEPQAGTVFVLLGPHGAFLPTVKSRCLPYPGEIVEEETQASVKKFLAAAQKDRSTEIATLLKEEDGARDRARAFVDALEAALLPHIARPEVREGLADISRVRSYLGDRSPSLKMLLEHLAAVLPKLP